jgi:ABC-type amino acid transport substrate-binding protein
MDISYQNISNKVTKMRKIFHSIAFALIILGTCFLGSCVKQKEESKIILLASDDNAPYTYQKEEKNLGFEIDLMQQIASKIGKELVVKQCEFGAMFTEMNNNPNGCAVSCISITPERKTRFHFSDPYSSTTLVMLSKKDRKIASHTDLFNKTLGVCTNTTCEDGAKKISNEVFGLIIKSVQNNNVLTEEMLSDNVDAIIVDSAYATDITKKNPDINALTLPESIHEESHIGIMLPQNSILKDKIDTAISEMNRDGSMDLLKEKWNMTGKAEKEADTPNIE